MVFDEFLLCPILNIFAFYLIINCSYSDELIALVNKKYFLSVSLFKLKLLVGIADSEYYICLSN